MRIGIGIGISRARRAGSKGPVNTVAPEVTGTAERGEVLTCSTGTWTGTGSITYAYQWYRSGVLIIGATSSTYTLVGADDNAQMSCAVTATDDEGSRVAFSNAVGPVLGAPFLLIAPVLSGTETVGEELSVTDGTWQGQATITFTYQWRRDGVNISVATSSTYTLVAADYNTVIDCVVTATNSLDSASADSNDTGAIAGLAPTNDTAPSIAGDDGLGDTLTRTAGSWSGVPTPSVSGQWRRNGVAIPSETGATYTITVADSGAVIDYLETATNAEGTATADSNDITVQTFTAPTNDVAPSITGNDPATIDDVLTRVEGTWSGNPTPTLAGEWYRNNVATGQTGNTYTITAADDDSFIFYRETATNALGTSTADSAAVTVEDFTVPVITGSPTIAGTEEVGETLTATAAAATGNPAPVTSWQWQRSANGVDGWANISGATSATYTLVAADETNYIRVQQIETNVIGSDTAVSASTGEITIPSTTGLLDSYTGAAAAFSLDTLIYSSHSVVDTKTGSETYNDPAAPYTVLVRRDTTPNAWRSFTHTEVGDGTLTTWVGAGNNGFVEVWYNQGSAGDAEQTTTTRQPKIVDNGALVVENGKAALYFNADRLTNSDLFISQPDYIFVLCKRDNLQSQPDTIIDGVNTQHIIYNTGNLDQPQEHWGAIAGGGFIGISNFNPPSLLIISALFDGPNSKIHGNGSLVASGNIGNNALDGISIGDLRGNPNPITTAYWHNGVIPALIIYPSDQSANRTGIETALNNYYNIY